MAVGVVRRVGIILGAAALVLVAAPAQAGETKDINTRDALVGDDPGYGKGRFTVEFLSKRTVDLKGWVADICPGDEQGIYVTVNRVRITKDSQGNPEYHHLRPQAIGADTNGCDNGKVRIDPGPITYKKAEMISIRLCEHDAADRGTKHDECWGEQFDNWRLWPN